MTIDLTATNRSLVNIGLATIFILGSLSLNAQGGGCTCTNCPQFMPDNFVGSFLINVMGSTNNTLGQNGQGVCGVHIHFDHEYLGDLSMVLTSPSGQSVTLVGPIGLFGPTDFTSWDVSFVPCGDAASPDPGFSAQWNNNQAWGLFGSYTGSYYPFQGCLENFNSGPVNGTWSLTVTDGQAVDVGNFLDYEIIFCDPSGINCISCAAEAGNLNQADVSACEGSPNLNLNLPPSYPPPLVAPPASDYSYTYVVSGAGGVILAYEPGPDLSSYAPGAYTICGFSYLTSEESSIPAPDGSLTTTQLNTVLHSTQPPFCGDISGNCVNVTINASPPDEEEFATICAPSCYDFHNQTYCNSGTYTRNLLSAQGCQYTATLYLTVVPVTVKNLTETICNGECAQTPGFEAYCSQGNYQEHFTTDAGCDSIVNLNLIVLSPVAAIAPPQDITCAQTTIQLSGAGSSTGGGVNYLWTASNGGHIVGNTGSLNILVDQPGDYQLRVCKTGGGVTCCDSAMVTVFSNLAVPNAPAAIAGPASLCQGETATYTATTVVGASSYTWTVPAGVTINSGQNTQSINVTWNSNSSGNICATANNMCGSSMPTCLNVAITPAQAPGQPVGNAAICAGSTETYSITAISNASTYTWTVTGGNIVSGQGTTGITVDWGNSNGSVCVNATEPCGISQDVCLPVTIQTIPIAPVIAGNGNSCPGDTAAYTLSLISNATTYHWQVTNGAIVSGQNTDHIQVLWNNNAASGTVCANAANSCGSGPDSCWNVSLSVPLAGMIDNTCNGTNDYYFVTFNVSGGTAPYAISGGVLNNGAFISDSILSGQPYNFVISDTNGCVSGAISGVFNCSCATDAGAMDQTPLAACDGQTVTANYLGGANLDANDIGAYFLHTGSGTSLGTVFDQNSTGVFGFVSGMVFETTYYISYVAGNNNGGLPDLADPCLSVTQGEPVVFHQNPVSNAGMDSDTCGLVQNLHANTGPGTGAWAVIGTPAGGALNFSGVQNPNASATATLNGMYQVSWTLNNNGCIDKDTVALFYNAKPQASNVVPACDATNDNYTVTFTISNGTSPYSVSGLPAGAVTGNSFTSSAIPNGSSYSYMVTDSAGCSSPPVTGAFNCNCSTSAGTMDVTQLSACEGGTVTANYLGGANMDGNDIGGYFLHSGSGSLLGTVYAMNNTGTFGLQPGMNYGTTYYISYVVGNNVNGIPDTTDFCLAVANGQPVVFHQNPVANAGLDRDTCGLALTLAGNSLPGSVGAWSISSGNSADLSIDQPANPVSDVSSAVPGIYTLTWTLTQNGCIGTDDVQLEFYELPALNNLTRDCDSTNQNFTVTLTLGGGTAPYTVNGAPVAGVNYTSTAFANGQGYTFNVADANGCAIAPISGSYSCNCSTGAGTMAAGILRACEGATISVVGNNDVMLDANDVVAFVLHTGSGPALGQILDENTSGIFSFLPGMSYGQTYYVSRVAGNPAGNFPDPQDPCFSVSAGQPVAWLQNPAPDAGEDKEFCGLDAHMQAQAGSFNGQWSQTSGPGTATFATPGNPTSVVSVTAGGVYIFRWTETNGQCSGQDEVQFTFNEEPQAGALTETCNNTNTQYVLTFSVTGGTAPFNVGGLAGSFTGNIFTSLPIPSGGSYTFTLSDANGCNGGAFSGTHNCACATDAGTMQLAPASFCANTAATVVWNNDGNLDGNDIVRFILHSAPDATLGTVYATNNQPTFNFGPGLNTGVVYYISAIAGNNVAGNVDTNDPCLSIAPGVPVQWIAMPNATLSGDAAVCAGNSGVLSFQGTGVYPLTVNYSVNGNPGSVTLPGNQMVTLNVMPATATTYSLTSVTDASTPGCATNLNQTLTMQVHQPVNAGMANEPVELCAGTGLPIVLSNLLTGADIGGKWTETSSIHSLPGAFNAATGTFTTNNQPPNTYTFQYLLTAAAPCPDDSEEVTVILHPQPVADAGEDQAINCDQVSVTLGGPNTSDGDYVWLQNNMQIGDARQIIVQDAGTYQLTVSTPDGCSSTDEANVVLDNQKPSPEKISVKGLKCYGDTDGAITVDSVIAAHMPVLYSINGGPFQTSNIFTGLPPGKYSITLQDNNGCEFTTTPFDIAEPAQVIADLGQTVQAELGDTVHLKLQTSIPLSEIDTVIWTPLIDTSANRFPLEQNFQPLQSWRIQVVVSDKNGCTGQDELLVKLEKPRNIYIPNVFNPENGQFPILYIYGGRDVVEIENFLIFDRWGTLLLEQQHFQPNDPTYGWDGRFKGEKLEPAVYVYQAKVRFIDGVEILFKGDIALIR